MKKLILGLLAASTIAAPAAAAPFDRGYHQGHSAHSQRFDRDGRFERSHERRWHRGERFDRRQARNYRVLSNPRAYRLYSAPRGYQWVRSGNDAVLVAITSGIIGAVLANALN